MSEFVETFDMSQLVNKYVERINRLIDEQALAQVKHQLAGYGYVKVVRCRDCRHACVFARHGEECWQCAEPYQEGDDVKPEAYCWRGERKEGGE